MVSLAAFLVGLTLAAAASADAQSSSLRGTDRSQHVAVNTGNVSAAPGSLGAKETAIDLDIARESRMLRAPGFDQYTAKINSALRSKLGEMNGHLAGMLKSKDPMPCHMNQGKVRMDQLYGISSLHINYFKVAAIAPPRITFSMSGSWRSFKLSGAAYTGLGRVPVSVTLQQVSFHTDHIVATFDMKKMAITNFHTSGIYVRIGSIYANVQVRSQFIAKMINRKATAKVNSQKGQIAGKIASKVTEMLDKVLNDKIKGAINAKIAGMMR